MEILIVVFLFLLGMAFGSFFNVCIYRLPQKQSLIPDSRCPQCDTPIKFYQNIPIFSYILLKGKCAHCGAKIHWHYFLVELITPLLFISLFFNFGFSFLLLKYIIFISAGIVIIFIDSFHKIIPDVISLPLLFIGLLFSLLPASDLKFVEAVIGTAFGFFLFWITSIAFDKLMKRESLGGGDIKLIAAIGSFLGIVGTIFTIIISSFSAIVLLLIIRHDKTKEFPFGPFLIFAAFCYILFGNICFDLYINLF